MVEVPHLGPDPLDEHGVPRGAPQAPAQPPKDCEPVLSRQRIRELADWYSDQGHDRYSVGTLDAPTLHAELRAILRKEVTSPEQVGVEFERVMQVVFAVR